MRIGEPVSKVWRGVRNDFQCRPLSSLQCLKGCRDCLPARGRLTPACLSPFSPQNFNAPPCSKMKLWKGATFAFVLCGAALTIVLIRNMTAVGHLRPKTKHSHTSSSSSRQSSASESASQHLPPSHHLSPEGAEAAAAAAAESSQHIGGLHRTVRSADQMNSLLSECKINC